MSEQTQDNSAHELLEQLGYDPEELVEKISNKDGKIDKTICSCGHARSRHYFDGETVSCQPTVMGCGCTTFAPILEASDTRRFLYKTEGSGQEHALIKGIAKAKVKEITVNVIPGATDCLHCGTSEKTTIHPLMETKNGWKIIHLKDDMYRAKANAFLCQDCSENFQ